ncbi:MAG: helix-turn-helix domain-containing protein [Bdellovibrionaceae bacterium]|nr:helix-turn-helix domain-containing protein [Pseudobdellovibrionaceae bacterium]
MDAVNRHSDSMRRIDEGRDFGYSGNENLLFENRVEREWLATNEAAHFLKVSENALRIMVHRGQIQAYKFGRRLRFRLCDLQALFQKKGA